MRIQTSIACFSLLAITSVLAKPGATPEKKSATPEIPKAIPVAIPVVIHPAPAKVYVKASAKPAAAANAGAAKPVARKPAPYPTGTWRLLPKVEDRGKEDTTYGFLLKHAF